jgi:DNA-directed RNA polymerase subunit omega
LPARQAGAGPSAARSNQHGRDGYDDDDDFGARQEKPAMPEFRPTMMDPPIESLLDKVDSKYTLVSLASKRGREVNSYFNQLGEGLGSIVPPQVTSISRKPLSIALEEISAGKITYHRLVEDVAEGEGTATL